MNVRIVSARACGKFILLGEHFIVSGGVSALAFPIPSFFCEVNLSRASENQFLCESQFPIDDEDVHKKMEEAFYTACAHFHLEEKMFQVHSKTNFPLCRGFGSSAAFSVALCRALSYFVVPPRKPADDGMGKSMDGIVQEVENLFHSKPSGLDTTIILEEKPLYFEKIGCFTELKNKACEFILVDSGEREKCSLLVTFVQGLRESDPRRWQLMEERMKRVVTKTRQALESGDFKGVAEGVLEAQDILSSLGLSTKKIDDMIQVARGEGALAGKVSGAGGGGAVVFITKKGQSRMIGDRLKKRGIEVLTCL